MEGTGPFDPHRGPRPRHDHRRVDIAEGTGDNPRMAASAPGRALRWVAPALLPAVNLALALLLAAVVVLAIGENPTRALWLLASGAFGNAEAVVV